MNQRIEITIDTKGDSTVETKGFSGSSCLEATRFLEQALGKAGQSIKTPEFHSATEQNPVQNSNGS